MLRLRLRLFAIAAVRRLCSQWICCCCCLLVALLATLAVLLLASRFLILLVVFFVTAVTGQTAAPPHSHLESPALGHRLDNDRVPHRLREAVCRDVERHDHLSPRHLACHFAVVRLGAGVGIFELARCRRVASVAAAAAVAVETGLHRLQTPQLGSVARQTLAVHDAREGIETSARESRRPQIRELGNACRIAISSSAGRARCFCCFGGAWIGARDSMTTCVSCMSIFGWAKDD
ncbi:hypothetical protein BC831DRAFT_454185, partial [Entophlyctis helioformis]